jgi:hypothetical protein
LDVLVVGTLAFDPLSAPFAAFGVSFDVLEFDSWPRVDASDTLVVGTLAFDPLSVPFGAFDVSPEALEFERDDALDVLVDGTLDFDPLSDPLLRPGFEVFGSADFVLFPTDSGVLLPEAASLSPFVVFLLTDPTPAAFLFVALGTSVLDAGLFADAALAMASFAAAFFLK